MPKSTLRKTSVKSKNKSAKTLAPLKSSKSAKNETLIKLVSRPRDRKLLTRSTIDAVFFDTKIVKKLFSVLAVR